MTEQSSAANGADAATTSYVKMQQQPESTTDKQEWNGADGGLTVREMETLRKLFWRNTSARRPNQQQALDTSNIANDDDDIDRTDSNVTGDGTLDSEYPEFTESTHAWAIFAGNPKKRASRMDRLVGTMIIAFQLFTYWMFAAEAVEDYEKGPGGGHDGTRHVPGLQRGAAGQLPVRSRVHQQL